MIKQTFAARLKPGQKFWVSSQLYICLDSDGNLIQARHITLKSIFYFKPSLIIQCHEM